MVGADKKSETITLKEKRDAIESEMSTIISRLCQPGAPGLSGNLLDSQGFPRVDIDIPTIVADRRRLSELRNDYKEITNKIDENLQLLLSTKRTQNEASSVKDSANAEDLSNSASVATSCSSHNGISEESSSSMEIEPVVGVPFAVVDEIADGSPAAEDGLQLGDQIVKFGNVGIGDDLLSRLASEAQLNKGRPVPLMILRQGAVINTCITPRPWHGRGLLGCHFRML